MKDAFSETKVLPLLGKICVPWSILLLYSCAFATSYWLETDQAPGQHWGLWTQCARVVNNTSNNTATSDDCRYIRLGESDAYFQAARVFAPFALVSYVALLFQMTLMDVRMLKGLLGFIIACTGAFFNVVVLMLIGIGFRSDTRWSTMAPRLSWSYWCALPSAVLALLDGLAMSLAAHKRRYPFGKRSPRKLKKATKKRGVFPGELVAITPRDVTTTVREERLDNARPNTLAPVQDGQENDGQRALVKVKEMCPERCPQHDQISRSGRQKERFHQHLNEVYNRQELC